MNQFPVSAGACLAPHVGAGSGGRGDVHSLAGAQSSREDIVKNELKIRLQLPLAVHAALCSSHAGSVPRSGRRRWEKMAKGEPSIF